MSFSQDEINLIPVRLNYSPDIVSSKLQLLTISSIFPKPLTKNKQSAVVLNNTSDQGDAKSEERSKSFPIKRSSSLRFFRSNQNSSTNFDLRFFIVRHGERVDRYFGPDWYQQALTKDGKYIRFHKNLPPYLPHRLNSFCWAQDTPLTFAGLKGAYSRGRMLSLNGVKFQYVYSSPAMRCILTTFEILRGLQLDKTIAIRIEPGLLELGAARFGMDLFMKPIDWQQHGVNIDMSYQPIVKVISADEREMAYYLRAKTVIRHLEERHKDSTGACTNILIVGHATSPETLTWDLIGKKPNVQDLFDLSLKVAYLQTMVAERRLGPSKSWSIRKFF